MKKLFVAFALVMGLGTTAVFADNNMSEPTSAVSSTTVVNNENEFVPIEIKDLPEAVLETLTKNYKDFTLKSAAVEANEDGTSTYQVVMADTEGTEVTVYFNEKGEVLE